MSGVSTASNEAMTVVRDASRRARDTHRDAQRARPVLACIDDGPSTGAVAHVADWLATRLSTYVLLATVQPAAPGMDDRLQRAGVRARESRSLLERAAQGIDRRSELRVAIGEPAERLLALAEREAAKVIVVAAPQDRRLGTLLLGSVYLALAGRGPCPVVIVPRAAASPATDGPIVCGVDGSAPSLRASAVAADFADMLGVPLRVLNVSTRARSGRDPLPQATPGRLALRPEAAAKRLSDCAARERAQFIVVSSRGAQADVSELVGSVSSRLAAMATTPVVVVPTPPGLPAVAPPLHLTETRLMGSAVMSAAGDIDVATAPRLEREATRPLADAGGRMVLDLSETSFIDLGGIRVIERVGPWSLRHTSCRTRSGMGCRL